MESSEIRVSGFGNVAGMPGGVTGSAVSNLGLSFFVAGDVLLDPGGELRKLFLARHGGFVHESAGLCQQASEVWLGLITLCGPQQDHAGGRHRANWHVESA
jgi:hypothetical protein